MTTRTKTGSTLTLERTIRAPRQRVFEAWTKPELLKRWHAPEGMDVAEVEVDLKADGRWRIVMEKPDGSERHTVVGTYREIEPPARLVSTWAWLDEAGEAGPETTITVELTELDGATRLVLVQEGFLDAESRDGHREGWASSLDRLERLFGGGSA